MNVVNLPDTQKVEVVNPQAPTETVAVSNHEQVTLPIVGALTAVLAAVQALSQPESNDKILMALERLIVAIDEKDIPQVDLAPVLSKLDETTQINVDIKIL